MLTNDMLWLWEGSADCAPPFFFFAHFSPKLNFLLKNFCCDVTIGNKVDSCGGFHATMLALRYVDYEEILWQK